MAKRGYKQFCGLARALDVVGERWTLLIVRELLLGPRRYSDLLEELPGITTNLLAKRMKELEAEGLVEKERKDGVTEYALTSSGAALEPAIMELARWGGRYLDKPRRGDVVDAGWGLLSLKRRYLGGKRLRAGVVVEGRAFELGLEPAYLAVVEREAHGAPLTLKLSGDALRALFWGGVPVEQLEKAGGAVVEGDRALVRELLSSFGPPQMAHQPRGQRLA